MSATTTLKLPDDVKTRVAEAAAASGKTAHAWMVEAIVAQAALAERRRDFVGAALLAEQEVAEYGLVFDADEVFSYITAKSEGRKSLRPKARKL